MRTPRRGERSTAGAGGSVSSGDLGEGNAGMLIFVDGRERPDYVPWTDVEQVDFDRAPAVHPPLGGR